MTKIQFKDAFTKIYFVKMACNEIMDITLMRISLLTVYWNFKVWHLKIYKNNITQLDLLLKGHLFFENDVFSKIDIPFFANSSVVFRKKSLLQ